MEKYATYQVFKNIVTGELKRIPLDNTEGIEKLGADTEWIELDYDPEEKE